MSSTSRFTRRSVLGSAAGLSLLLAVTACGGGSPLEADSAAAGGEAIVVGSANFPENAIIAELYAGALNAAGVSATTKLNIGAREVYIKAIEDGSVDIVPDYSGNLLGFVDANNTVSDPAGIVAALPDKLPTGLSVLEASSAEDKDALVVTAETAAKFGGLKTIEDLAKVCDQLTLGAPPEFKTRPYGLPGLESKYGCVPAGFTPVSDGGGPLTVKALLNDEIQVADIFTTSPDIPANNLVVLEDPLDNWLAQQVLPLVKTDRISDAATTALNELSQKLTTEDLIALRDQVEGAAKMDAKDAATAWLSEQGITA